MNKLEKWLWVNCTLKDNGQNSNSLYFYYKNLEIRYSDHMAKQSTGDLQIIKSSVFDSINYAVFNNVEVKGKSFKLQEVLIDNLDAPQKPLGGNFG